MPAPRAADLAVVAAAVAVDLVAWNGDRELRSGDLLPWPAIPALVVVVHLVLLWRHRHPVGVFAIQLGFALCCSAVPQFQAFAGLLVALFVVAARFGLSRSLAALALTLVPFAVHTSSAAARSLADGAQLLILWTGFSAAVWGVGRYCFVAAQRDRLLREQRAHEAVAAERQRLARELHDTISHSVTTMIIQAAGCRAQTGVASATSRALGVIQTAGEQAMTELHQMLDLLDDAREPHLDDVATLIESARATGRRVGLVETGTKIMISSAAETTAYRIVQESLTNALKYAGSEASVAVRLRWERNGLEVDVTDRVQSGQPGPAAVDLTSLSAGRGLLGLRCRVESLGGSMRAGPTDDGYRVSARLPSTSDRLVPYAA